MSVGIQGIMNWQTWQGPFTAVHTAITTFEPGDYAADQSISVTPYTAIQFFPLCLANDNEVISIKMIGYMTPHITGGIGPGPGQALFFLQLTAGGVVMSSAIPLADGSWAEGNWRFFDTVDSSTTVWFDDISVVERGSAETVGSGQMSLMIPTLGYTNLMLEVTDPGGSSGFGGSMTSFQALYRGISKEGAL